MNTPLRRKIVGSILGFLGYFLTISPSLAQSAAALPGNAELLKLIATDSKTNGKKDDYETTEAYHTRLATNVGREFLLSAGLNPRIHSKSRAFSYNADTQTLTVTLVGDSSLSLLKMLSPLSAEGKRLGSSTLLAGRYTKFTLMDTGPILQREYEGTNAMGVKAIIKVMRSEFTAIAFLNVPESPDHPLPVQEVKVPPEAAKRLSNRAEWRLLVRTAMLPDQNALVLEDIDYLKPTITDPYEITIDGRTITASLYGAQLVDPDTNAVIAAFSFKGGPGAQAPPVASNDHAVLGVLLAPVSAAIAAALALPSTDGALVTSVAQGGTADKAGIKVGDIMLTIGQTPIKSPLDVGAAISAKPVGSSISVKIIHQGAPAEVTVTF